MGVNRYGRYGRPYRRFRELVKAQGRPCSLCGHPIDRSLPATHPLSWSLDHSVPVSRGGAAVDKRNGAGAHLICNMRKGNRTNTPTLRTTRQW